MFTVLFSDTSYNRLGVRLFSYPPSKPRGEGSRERPRNREPKKQEYRTEAVLIADLDVVIDEAIRTKPKNLEQASAFSLELWKYSLIDVNREADKLLTGLENLELPDDLKADAQALSEKARHLSLILPNDLPKKCTRYFKFTCTSFKKVTNWFKITCTSYFKKVTNFKFTCTSYF